MTISVKSYWQGTEHGEIEQCHDHNVLCLTPQKGIDEDCEDRVDYVVQEHGQCEFLSLFA